MNSDHFREKRKGHKFNPFTANVTFTTSQQLMSDADIHRKVITPEKWDNSDHCRAKRKGHTFNPFTANVTFTAS